MSGAVLRELSGMAEFLAAERLQRAVWGGGDSPDPADLMMVVQAEGGLCAGAFRDGRLLAYVFGFPTRDPGAQHSHRLAVLPEARGQKLGLRLKWFQRDWSLARGITRLRWTFDPLRRLNAALNIDALGARAHLYHPDYYGEMAGINAGLPSDRLAVEWRLDTPEVSDRAAGHRAGPEPKCILGRVPIPPDSALTARLRLREDLQAAFAEGLEIGGFDRGTDSYLLVRRHGSGPGG
ncbi:MAG: GNAT family N-acetyltransferase [Paracoccus sp. (in: a-proteobacteria)]